jgi:hypothetical protein
MLSLDLGMLVLPLMVMGMNQLTTTTTTVRAITAAITATPAIIRRKSCKCHEINK